MKPLLHPRLSLAPDGVSEFTFAGLYLFREHYGYRVSRSGTTLVISGKKDGKSFFMTPCAVPEISVLEELFDSHDCWKNIPRSVLDQAGAALESCGIAVEADRDNFDYLYLRTDLAELAGKRYHKKRNQVNGFVMNYEARKERLDISRTADARRVLDQWREGRQDSPDDYDAAKEALERLGELRLRGAIWYTGGQPVAWCLGESLARGRAFAVHFEKALEDYKGLYQYINQDFAAALPRWYVHINREQDLGDEGLRQAKMTWRPSGFVEKYTGKRV